MQRHNRFLRLPLPARPIPRRTASSSSDASRASHASLLSLGSEDQFVFSPADTPATENPPSRVSVPRYASDLDDVSDLLLDREVSLRPRDPDNDPPTANPLEITPNSTSRPIPIQAPASRRKSSGSAAGSIPPEPLSARGDVPGGYFPLHEDPKSRVHIPHPFQLDSEMARQSSLRRAAESSKASADPRPSTPLQPSGSAVPPLHRLPSVVESSDNPISSYIPSGIHDDVVLPLGKYYPTNWERRHGKASRDRPSLMAQPAASAIRSEPQVPKYHGDQARPRPGLDVKRRLQQYQRDMVAQAAMAASALIASSGAANPATASSLSGVPLPKVQLAANFLKAHKPVSPRLRPVGSPGPVTPMSLEGESYLSLGSSGRGMDMDAESPTVEKGTRDKSEPRTDGSCSSPLELSAASI